MMYTDFPYYQDGYCGTAITDAVTFRTAAARASEYMDSVTFGRIRPDMLHSSLAPAIQNCCCALAEAMVTYQLNGTETAESSTKKSETQHNYSVTYATPVETLGALLGSNATIQDYLYQTAMRYLGRTGLLYRGCD
ncbi:MAG: hypothetical protein Q4D37_05635 [Oscillospiraceae bacterium]|nr:hypothetical protein [Oscillospiraceae bacterium]